MVSLIAVASRTSNDPPEKERRGEILGRKVVEREYLNSS